MSRLLPLLLAILMADSADAQKQVFPESWDEPPAMQTMDYRALPGGYGHGSSTLAMWINEQMAKEKAKTGRSA